MARKKLKRLEEIKTFKNVFGINSEINEEDIKEFFSNDNPFALEVGCGNGDYTFNMAQEYKEMNFLGLDLKPARIYIGSKYCLENNINNAAFLATRADLLPGIFKTIKFKELYIPFPDPHFRRRSAKRRLVSEVYLDVYKKILANDGVIHFKTDNTQLYEFALETFRKNNINIIEYTSNLYEKPVEGVATKVKTKYEKHYLEEGRIIKYIAFNFA